MCKNNKTPIGTTWLALEIVLFCFPLLVSVAGCGEDNDNDDTEHATALNQRFTNAEAMDADWCLEAQLDLAALAGTEWTTDKIHVTKADVESEVSNLKTGIDPSSERPIQIISYVGKMKNTIEVNAPDTIGRIIWCKLRAQDGMERELGVDISGEEGTCRHMNERALEWGLGQLTAKEKARYDAEGKKIEFADDIMGESGGEWYGQNCEFIDSDVRYQMASSALLVPYDDYPDLEEELRGVHYCKLLAPSQILFWVLQRAYWNDPFGPGPNNEGGVALRDQEDACKVRDATSPGSCIFYFKTSNQYYCEEYTGVTWDAASAEAKCDTRDEGVFSSEICTNRTDETSSIDGDGEYKGVCLINCGNDGEYRWHVYSYPEEGTIEAACPDWFPSAD